MESYKLRESKNTIVIFCVFGWLVFSISFQKLPRNETDIANNNKQTKKNWPSVCRSATQIHTDNVDLVNI